MIDQVIHCIDEQGNGASPQRNDQSVSPLYLADILRVEQRSQFHHDDRLVFVCFLTIAGAPVNGAESRDVFAPYHITMPCCANDK